MSWYDTFAEFYEGSVERVYARYRASIAAAACLSPGGAVLDLPVGTGPNLPHLAAYVGAAGVIVGVDLSEGMLRRATLRVLRAPRPRAVLLAADARTISPALLAELGVAALDAVVVSLGLTVFPAWESVFAATFDLLRPGGRYVIFDVHQDRWVPQSTIVSLVAGADMRRRVWEPLEASADGFALQWLPGSRYVHGGRPFLASGVRRGG
ncbi:MAG: class I SAM-dependent methyltransferase [Deltaproteobacteria bacterium]|nr:class I SAM-dependent methyltransferase [Deltaproteobacteria bacterium]